MKLVNKCLAITMKEYNVFKGSNYVTLPGKSTFEPIQVLNAIVEEWKI